VIEKSGLRKLQEISVAGNFTFNCDTIEEFQNLRRFFCTHANVISFNDIHKPLSIFEPSQNHVPKDLKFVVRYNSLNQLLKLRETFRARGTRFDMYLIKKRKMGDDFFDENLYDKLLDPVIYKIIT